MKSPSPMSLLANVIVPWTRSVHDVSPSGMRKRIANGIPAATRRATSSARERAQRPSYSKRVAARLGGFAHARRARRACRSIGTRASASSRRARVGLMPREVRALIHDVLVPAEAEPVEALEDRARALVGAARAVGVLDAQQELAAVVLGVEPVEERRAGAADVEVSRRRRSEAKTMSHDVPFEMLKTTRARRLRARRFVVAREGRDSNPRYGFKPV